MERLSQNLIDTVCEHMQGKRREKLLESVQLLNASIDAGGWLQGASRKATSGFNQGLVANRISRLFTYDDPEHGAAFKLEHCLCYGSNQDLGTLQAESVLLNPAVQEALGTRRKRPSDEAILAWVRLCKQKSAAVAVLEAARPLPVITAIGLSPKVTATLKECRLDIDLPSIKLAKLERHERMVQDRGRNGDLLFNSFDGSPKMKLHVWYTVAWTPGIKHNQSRFVSGCQACGKRIPSGRYVAVEASCKRNGLISMWIGCDCARNIFGIKDVGVERTGGEG